MRSVMRPLAHASQPGKSSLARAAQEKKTPSLCPTIGKVSPPLVEVTPSQGCDLWSRRLNCPIAGLIG
eukprot:3439609-Alexandrium_andersonii.AAC.1